MSPHLDELGGKYACRTIIGRKGLVQLSHNTADADVIFDKVYLHSGIRKVQRRLDSCYPRPYNHNSADLFAIFYHRFLHLGFDVGPVVAGSPDYKL